MLSTPPQLDSTPLLDWFARERRDLPWREPGTTPWGVLVSEVMSQQTPVSRVAPAWTRWMMTWPTPSDLAAAPTADVLRAWDRLGYPRRALRLQACAAAIVEKHGGRVPDDEPSLLALPGIGSYTAAAVLAFAFGKRSVVVDTNIRRAQARIVTGVHYPSASLTAAESRLASALVPDDDAEASLWNVAVMELGALVCTAKAPRCDDCPMASQCAWLAAGRPAHDGPPRKGQAWAGTDRQVRGKIMAVLRESHGGADEDTLRGVWPEREQWQRCLNSLLLDGLVVEHPAENDAVPHYTLP